MLELVEISDGALACLGGGGWMWYELLLNTFTNFCASQTGLLLKIIVWLSGGHGCSQNPLTVFTVRKHFFQVYALQELHLFHLLVGVDLKVNIHLKLGDLQITWICGLEKVSLFSQHRCCPSEEWSKLVDAASHDVLSCCLNQNSVEALLSIKGVSQGFQCSESLLGV